MYGRIGEILWRFEIVHLLKDIYRTCEYYLCEDLFYLYLHLFYLLFVFFKMDLTF